MSTGWTFRRQHGSSKPVNQHEIAALRLLDADELQALLAHELGHEYVWSKYKRRTALGEATHVKELELVCDGIAIVMLRELRIDASRLITAIEKLTRLTSASGTP